MGLNDLEDFFEIIVCSSWKVPFTIEDDRVDLNVTTHAQVINCPLAKHFQLSNSREAMDQTEESVFTIPNDMSDEDSGFGSTLEDPTPSPSTV